MRVYAKREARFRDDFIFGHATPRKSLNTHEGTLNERKNQERTVGGRKFLSMESPVLRLRRKIAIRRTRGRYSGTPCIRPAPFPPRDATRTRQHWKFDA